MLEALFFDFDGVVVNSEPVHCDCFRRIMRAEYGVDFTEEEYYAKYLAYTDDEAFEMICGEHGIHIDARTVRQLSARKTQLVQESFATSIPAMPGAVELMRAARAAGIGVAICSGAQRKEIELAAGTVAALPHVQLIVSAEDVVAGKPDPTGYRLARQRLSALVGRELPAQRCVVIEDAPAGVAAGKGGGMRVLAVTNSIDGDSLRQADRVVASLANVTLDDLRKLID